MCQFNSARQFYVSESRACVVKTDIRSYNISISDKRHGISPSSRSALPRLAGNTRALITVTFRPSDRLSSLLVAARSPLRPTNRRTPLASLQPYESAAWRGVTARCGAYACARPIRRISIRVATLAEAGQFSPVREIGSSFARDRPVRSQYRVVPASDTLLCLSFSLDGKQNVRDAERGLETPVNRPDGGVSRDTCVYYETQRGIVYASRELHIGPAGVTDG